MDYDTLNISPRPHNHQSIEEAGPSQMLEHNYRIVWDHNLDQNLNYKFYFLP
jgi:hypothetical protein